MPERIDLQFFQSIADLDTYEQVKCIFACQEKMLRYNEMPLDENPIHLNLDGRDIWIESASAVNALEIYQEIFRDNDHAKASMFIPSDKMSVVFDIGANYGFYGLWVKKHVPDIHLICVEPNPYLFGYLKKNLEGFDNVFYENKAVTGYNGTLSMDIIRQVPSIGGKTIGMTPRNWVEKDMVQSLRVPCTTLETLIEKYPYPHIDLVKMDIEGDEGEVLLAASLKSMKKIKLFVVERHSKSLRQLVLERTAELGLTLVYDQDPSCKKHYGNLFFARKANFNRRNEKRKGIHKGI